jgi:hypothetical protein
MELVKTGFRRMRRKYRISFAEYKKVIIIEEDEYWSQVQWDYTGSSNLQIPSPPPMFLDSDTDDETTEISMNKQDANIEQDLEALRAFIDKVSLE